MKTTERAAGPALGAAFAYFTVKFATPEIEWLTVSDQIEAVAMLTVLYTHLIMEARAAFQWIVKRNIDVTNSDEG